MGFLGQGCLAGAQGQQIDLIESFDFKASLFVELSGLKDAPGNGAVDQTGAAAVMSSEALLENPALFVGNRDGDGAYLDQDELARRYLDAAEEHPPGKGIAIVKGHLFKVVQDRSQPSSTLAS